MVTTDDDGAGEQAPARRPVRYRKPDFEPRTSDIGEGVPEDRLLTDDEMAERFQVYGKMSRRAAEAAVRFIRSNHSRPGRSGR